MILNENKNAELVQNSNETVNLGLETRLALESVINRKSFNFTEYQQEQLVTIIEGIQ